MFLRRKIIFILLTMCLAYAQNSKKPTLLFYCGITMVEPMKEIAKIIEKKHNCKIKISQGGSKDLYDSLKYSKKGDLYLPGSQAYVINNIKDGFIIESKLIGHNQAAIFVQKTNPLKVKNLEDFKRDDLSVILSNPYSGSIGKMTKNIFKNYKDEEFYETIFDKTIAVATDSRIINQIMIEKKADISINWKATASWNENSKYLDIIELDEKFAPQKKLYINLLQFSKHKDIAKAFINYCASKEGQAIMKKYGFL